jgi:hypothetical protein
MITDTNHAWIAKMSDCGLQEGRVEKGDHLVHQQINNSIEQD